jgi:uncharacterized protein (TIGR02284 family)
MAQNKENISTLNGLMETLKDGEEGLKSLFNEYSRQRARFTKALQTQVQSLGESRSEMSSSAAGALHRAWINLKSAVTSGDDHAILSECERGEDSAVKEYEKALNDDLSPSLREIVSSQYSEVKNAHDRVRTLRDAIK